MLASQAEILQLIERKDLPGSRGPIDEGSGQAGNHCPVHDFQVEWGAAGHRGQAV